MGARWSEGVWNALTALGERLAAIGPAILIALTMLVLGIVLGAILGGLVSRVARGVGFNRHMERWGIGTSLRSAGILRPASDVLGLLFFWTTFVVFASLGIDALGFGRASARLLDFLPALFAAVLILVVGWLVANFLSQGLLIAAVNAGLPEARLLARAAHWAVVLFAGATALTQLGIGKEMVLIAFGITFGGLVLALALAFGLGGRGVARELLERRLRRDSPPPQERLTHL
jgi:hypothetical protein